MRLLPSAEVGFLGMHATRDLDAITYATASLTTSAAVQVYVLDPMLAPAVRWSTRIRFLLERGADDITAVCLLAAPEASRTSPPPSPTKGCRSPS